MPWSCEFCNESFEDQEALGRHIHKRHRNKVKLAIFEHPLRPKAKVKSK